MVQLNKRKIKIGRVIPILCVVLILFIGCFMFGYYRNNEDADFATDIRNLLKQEEADETIGHNISEEAIASSEMLGEVIPPLPQTEEELKAYLEGLITPEGQVTSVAKEAPQVKGVYVTGPVAGHARMEEIIQLIDETELNAVVIDVKNDDGLVTYSMDNETVQALGATIKYVRDMPGLIQRLHDKGIYVIARIVAFRDPHLADAKPEWSVHKTNGSIYYDNSGLAWVNPYKREVWDYLVEIAACAAEDGFDEIQFDYVRFSTEIKSGTVNYGEDSDVVSKQEIITAFTKYAHEQLSPLGVKVSADVFGTIIDNENDSKIVGQEYEQISSNLDVICPMIYPSHYVSGVYGQKYPNSSPYEMIMGALQASESKLEEIAEEQRPVVRPWLQDFTASWVKPYHAYGAEEVRAQIQAVYDAGYSEWILWNASNRYTKEALLPAEDTSSTS